VAKNPRSPAKTTESNPRGRNEDGSDPWRKLLVALMAFSGGPPDEASLLGYQRKSGDVIPEKPVSSSFPGCGT
jgi:hypothetical protein